MSKDPRTYVIARLRHGHDVANLLLCDRSSFVTSGRRQLPMRIEALAVGAAKNIGRCARRHEVFRA
jgi:hypothetical protein